MIRFIPSHSHTILFLLYPRRVFVILFFSEQNLFNITFTLTISIGSIG